MVRLGNPTSTPFVLTLQNHTYSDFLAFALFIFLANSSKTPGFNFPGLWMVIAKDATRYFLVIFTSHFVLEMFLIFTRVSSTISIPER
jgi:hypothetical protein